MLKKSLEKFGKILELATSIAFIFLMLVVILQMIGRWFKMTGIGWTDEMVSCGTTWMVLLGCSYLAERGGHVRVDIFTEKLGGMFKKILEIVIQLLNLACGGFILYSGYLWLKNTVGKITPILQIQYSIWYSAILVFGILFTLFSLYKFCMAVQALFTKDTGLVGE